MSDRLRLGFAGIWLVAALAAGGILSAGLGPRMQLPDWGHLVGHMILFGVLGMVLASVSRSVHLALFLTLLGGAGLELTQAIGLHFEGVALRKLLALLIPEAGFDMTVNAVSAMFGIAVARPQGAAKAIGSWLHPVVIGPIATAGLGWAAHGRVIATAFWTAMVVACFSPAVLAWAVGVRSGLYVDADLRDRSQRPLLFGIACACGAVYAGITGAISDPPFPTFGMALFGSAVVVTATTTAGLKISGHVSAPLVLAACMAPWSGRGTAVLLASAMLLSWARVRDRCHRPHEVAAAWAMGIGLWVALEWSRSVAFSAG